MLTLCACLFLFGASQTHAQNAVNTATVTVPSGVVDPDTSNNSATDSDPIVAPQLTLTKSHTGDFTVGANGVYILTPGNTGTAPTTGTITISDTLPNGLTYVSGTGTGWTCSVAGQVVTCTSTTPIAANATGNPITLTVAVAAAAVPSATNSARISGGGDATCPATGATQGRCTPSDPTTVVESRITTIKSANPASGTTVSPGQTITYTVTATISGAPPPVDVTLSDTLGAGLTLTSVPAQCSAAAQVLTCVVPAGTPVGDYTVTYTATVDADATGSVGNNVTGGAGCGTPGGCTTTHPIVASAVTVAKNSNPASGSQVTPGDTIGYTLTVTVANSATTDAVTLTDTLSTGQTLVTPLPSGCSASGQVVTCVLAAGALPGAYTFAYSATVDAAATGSVSNAVVPSGGDNPTCTTCTTDHPVTAATTTVVKTADPATGTTVSPGDTITYTLTTTVAGSALTQDLTLADTLSANQSFGAVTAPGAYTCSGAVSCVLPAGTLPGSYAVSYTATVNADATGNVGNAVVATNPPGGDPDPVCTTCTTDHPVGRPSLSTLKTMTGYTDADGDGAIGIGDTLSYAVTVTNTGNVPLNNVTINDAMLTPSSATCPLVAPSGTCVLTGTYVVTQVDANAGQVVNTALVTSEPPPGGPPLPPEACPTGSSAPRCAPSVTTPVIQRPAIATTKIATLTTDNGTPGVGNTGDVITYAVTTTNTGNVTLQNIVVQDSFQGQAPTTLTCAPTTLAPGASATCNTYTHTVTDAEAQAGDTLDNTATASGNAVVTGATVTVTSEAEAEVAVASDDFEIRLGKRASARTAKVGDLVRYTLVVENFGISDLVNGSIVDTPAPGFTYVDGSLVVADDDNAGTASGYNPIRFSGIDVKSGETATLMYTMRVGAGVKPGAQVNRALTFSADNTPISNVATAEVLIETDALVDDSLLFGTVFDDRDGDGWQDSAALSGVHVQGGFAPGAYVAGSTTVDFGDGPQPQADASAPMLHGIDIGAITSRQSVADPASDHQVVIRQRLSAPEFTDDFVLTSRQGVTVRMDAAGNTTVERTGEAEKGLTGADPIVERRVAQGEGGYVVDYTVRNAGIDERGIPGVRIASVEGLLMETDQFGRYHLAGISGGELARGRNFILKVDPSTLPPGTPFTTDNPLVRRITPGVPVRFDFGVKLPVERIPAPTEQVELELGTVIFAPGSADVRDAYLPAIDKMADKVAEYRGGEVVITATGDDDALAFARASAVQAALQAKLPAEVLQALTVTVRGQVEEPDSLVAALNANGPLLGSVLFDTDKSTIKPQYRLLLDKVAAYLEQRGGGVVSIVGHADQRASDAYNLQLGMRRARAVYEAISAKLSPEVREKVRVEASDDPGAPAGAGGGS